MYLLEGADDARGVACLGGECFGDAGAGFLRLSCAEPDARLIEATRLARQAGAAKASNMVMVGAASRLLPLDDETLESLIRETFAAKGDKVVEVNVGAFRAGRQAFEAARA